MISKTKIAKIRLLHQKKYRESEQLFIVEGTKSVLECINSRIEIQEIFAKEAWISANERSLQHDFSVSTVSEKEMERISCLSTPSEVFCIAKIPQYRQDQLENNVPLLVLDGINDPGNLGTIIRTADWFGFNTILCSENTVEFTNPKVIQATMGSFCRVKIIYANLPEFLQKENDRPILGMFMEGESLQNIDIQYNAIVVLGSESHGISAEVEKIVTQKIHIPASRESCTESLNASIAASILMYSISSKNNNLSH